MTSFDFSDDQIVSIVAYIKNYKPEVSASVASSSSEDLGNFSNDNIISDGYFFILGCILLFILALILFLLILMFNFVISLVRLKSNLSDSDKVFIEKSVSFRKIFQNSIFKRLVFFVFVSVIFKSVISGLFSIGVQKGYSPRQPIAFSHQIHVGQYQIDCQYCHTGVVKSKNANIPSLNICMNCHSAIKKDSVEIKKIYLAIENNIPIE
jgi:cytochrome c553